MVLGRPMKKQMNWRGNELLLLNLNNAFLRLGRHIMIFNEEINWQQCRPIKCNSLVLMNSLGKKAIQMTTKVRPSLGPWNEHRSWYLNTFWVVWKTLSYIYLGSTGFWQIFLKFVTNIPFCNSLDKLFGQKNPIIFSPALAPLSQSLVIWAQCVFY